MIKITIMLEEQLGADRNEVSSQVTDAIWSVLEQPGIQALAMNIDVSAELGDDPSFYPKPDKAIEKTEANSCQLRYLGGHWVISEARGDYNCSSIEAVIAHMNHSRLYLTNETIMTAEYAAKLWYKA